MTFIVECRDPPNGWYQYGDEVFETESEAKRMIKRAKWESPERPRDCYRIVKKEVTS